MKKALLVVSGIVLAGWLVTWVVSRILSNVWDEDAVATSAAKPWPGGRGTLESVFKRFPPLEANDASRKLTALADALPKNNAADDFVWREIGRGEIAIGDPPALADVSAIRDLLLRERVVWKRHDGIGNDETETRRALHLMIARALVASALAKARTNDPASWEDLDAVWNLARSLDGHPQMMVQTSALSMERMVNAVAWKMPMPAPSWFSELHARDAVPALLEAFQNQAASYWEDVALPTKWLAASVEHDRLIAQQVFNATRCDAIVRSNDLGVDVKFIWRRAFRYRAEREATANALRVRAGTPIETKSECSEGTWSFDGTTLRFSPEIPPSRGDRPMPLVLRVKL